MKCRAVSDFPLGPDPTALALDDALNRRQADSRSREIARQMQALKSPEQLAGVRRVEAGAVVPDEVFLIAVLSGTSEFDSCMQLFGGEFPGIAEQVGQHDPHQAWVRFSNETIGNHDFGVTPRRGGSQFLGHLMSHLA